MTQAFISAASAMHPEQSMRKTFRLLASRMAIQSLSTVYVEIVKKPAPPAFRYTCVIEIDTSLEAQILKRDVLDTIAFKAGRTRDNRNNSVIDLDLILYGQLTITEGELIIPHPDILQRPVLIIALNELVPDLVLPGTSVAVAIVAKSLSRVSIKPLLSFSALLQQELRTGFKTPKKKKNDLPAAG